RVAECSPDALPGERVEGELAAGGVFDLLAAEGGQDQSVEDIDAELSPDRRPDACEFRRLRSPVSFLEAGLLVSRVSAAIACQPSQRRQADHRATRCRHRACRFALPGWASQRSGNAGRCAARPMRRTRRWSSRLHLPPQTRPRWYTGSISPSNAATVRLASFTSRLASTSNASMAESIGNRG